MYSGVPDDEEMRQYRRLCQAVGLRVGQRPVAETCRQAADRIADLRELHDLYRQRDTATGRLKRAELVIVFSLGVVVGAAANMIDHFIRGSL